MPKNHQVTYSGKAGRYFVTDKSGKRWYFPRGKPVTVPEAVAELLPKNSSTLKISSPAAAGGEENK